MSFIGPVANKIAISSVLLLMISGTVNAVETTVLTEEIVTRYAAANNGAGPLWC